MLLMHNGAIYPVKSFREGVSAKGYTWRFCDITDSRGHNKTKLWIANEDHGLSEGYEGNVRVDSFGVDTENAKEGISYGMKEYPKGSGKWNAEVSCSGCIVHAVGDANDSGADFTTPDFTTVDTSDADLPF